MTSLPPSSAPTTTPVVPSAGRVPPVSTALPLAQGSPMPTWNDPPTFTAKTKVFSQSHSPTLTHTHTHSHTHTVGAATCSRSHHCTCHGSSRGTCGCQATGSAHLWCNNLSPIIPSPCINSGNVQYVSQYTVVISPTHTHTNYYINPIGD